MTDPLAEVAQGLSGLETARINGEALVVGARIARLPDKDLDAVSGIAEQGLAAGNFSDYAPTVVGARREQALRGQIAMIEGSLSEPRRSATASPPRSQLLGTPRFRRQFRYRLGREDTELIASLAESKQERFEQTDPAALRAWRDDVGERLRYLNTEQAFAVQQLVEARDMTARAREALGDHYVEWGLGPDDPADLSQPARERYDDYVRAGNHVRADQREIEERIDWHWSNGTHPKHWVNTHGFPAACLLAADNVELNRELDRSQGSRAELERISRSANEMRPDPGPVTPSSYDAGM